MARHKSLMALMPPNRIKSAFRGMELSEWSASLGNPLSFFMAGGQAHAGRPTRSCRT